MTLKYDSGKENQHLQHTALISGSKHFDEKMRINKLSLSRNTSSSVPRKNSRVLETLNRVIGILDTN